MHLKHNIKLDLGKYKSSTYFSESGEGIIFCYNDNNTGQPKKITYFLDKGYTGQRPLSEFIYDYWKNEDGEFPPFVAEYAYFKREENVWITAYEEIVPYTNKYLEYAIIYPSVLFGYERISSLLEFADEINPLEEDMSQEDLEDIEEDEPIVFFENNVFFENKFGINQIKLSYV